MASSIHLFLFSSTCSFGLSLKLSSPLPSAPKNNSKLFLASRARAPAPAVLAYQCSSARAVCSANLNHIGWAHLWKQMSTGAGMLFLFRVERLCYGFPPPPPLVFPLLCTVSQVPQQADLASAPRQEGPPAAWGRGQEAPVPRLYPLLFILILALLTDDNEQEWSKTPSLKWTDIYIYIYISILICYEAQNNFGGNLKLPWS